MQIQDNFLDVTVGTENTDLINLILAKISPNIDIALAVAYVTRSYLAKVLQTKKNELA